MKKNLLSIIILFSASQISFAQILHRSIINATGGTLTNGNVTMTTSVGEPDVQKYQNGIILYQGFLQPVEPRERTTVNSVANINPVNGISLFPNPVINYLTVQTSDNTRLYFSISNVLGKRVKEDVLQGDKIYFGDLADGVYVLMLSTADHKVISTTKIIKQ